MTKSATPVLSFTTLWDTVRLLVLTHFGAFLKISMVDGRTFQAFGYTDDGSIDEGCPAATGASPEAALQALADAIHDIDRAMSVAAEETGCAIETAARYAPFTAPALAPDPDHAVRLKLQWGGGATVVAVVVLSEPEAADLREEHIEVLRYELNGAEVEAFVAADLCGCEEDLTALGAWVLDRAIAFVSDRNETDEDEAGRNEFEGRESARRANARAAARATGRVAS